MRMVLRGHYNYKKNIRKYLPCLMVFFDREIWIRLSDSPSRSCGKCGDNKRYDKNKCTALRWLGRLFNRLLVNRTVRKSTEIKVICMYMKQIKNQTKHISFCIQDTTMKNVERKTELNTKRHLTMMLSLYIYIYYDD